MVKQGWSSLRTTRPFYRRISAVAAAILVFALLLVLLMLSIRLPSLGHALMATTKQYQLHGGMEKQQLGKTFKGALPLWRWWWWWWCSLSGNDGGSTSSKKRRLLIGSSPPTCRFRCGRCAPCRPVHVPIQPGRSSPLEYYPEAWRCQCGNRLFMP